MTNKPWKVMTTVALAGGLLISAGCTDKEKVKKGNDTAAEEGKSSVSVPVTDYTFDTAGNMFAYAEFELSGEPLVEGLGLDLDVLDPKKVNKPEKFDYTAGIEAYEYSEEGMYEVVEKSGLGLHLINGPVVNEMAKTKGKATDVVLGERFYELADAVGYPKEEIFRNMFPTFIEYGQGDPHYVQEVDTEEYASNDDGTYIPNYQVNFKSLRWDRNKMDHMLTPAAYGGTFLKQSLWAGDFLGGFHTVKEEEELAGETGNDDKDPNIRLGVSSPDGMQGMILVEEIWNKLNFIRDGLFYNANAGKLIKAENGSTYDPAKGLVYLPHQVKVEENGEDLAPSAKSLQIADERSLLNDQWLMLWPAAEFYGMTDQRSENKNVSPSFQALFDGKPYPSAPKENVDADSNNDISSSDPYSVNKDVLLHVFKNLDAMHFNKETGSFVTEHDGKSQGKYIDTFQAGYTVEALRIFQRAIDGLPVGYASGEAAEGLKTVEGKRAIELIKSQADFIINELVLENGLVAKGYTVGKGADTESTLEAQLGAIRGLTAAYLATDDDKYREAARNIFIAMDDKLWDNEANAYKTYKDEMQYTPYTAGGVAAVFRVAIQNLSNQENDKQQPESLEVESIISKYSRFFETVIDGPSLDQGMQASEFWDTGDFYFSGKKSENTDKDNVPQIQAGHGKFGIAPVLVPVEVKKK
ncbi:MULTISPECIES: hypothetical protein [unclassified Bacillus (in: firmicutes)]|uniref:hypothetical protein n=1 Tax=unclassified Bacillus (in: firmicutes) TaxID=185979 RepID=UPI0008E03434|nr:MULTISPECIES: hypothetical protein [unclassified Bacillus (in: firmicutes)]SFA71225.1 hypothetical protein SAMN02799634_101192 [Bacillus sp. UNCCL13]SFQ61380.1 hypothetical protein SAMN04488577_0474 [Bacillus sp. cl95]